MSREILFRNMFQAVAKVEKMEASSNDPNKHLDLQLWFGSGRIWPRYWGPSSEYVASRLKEGMFVRIQGYIRCQTRDNAHQFWFNPWNPEKSRNFEIVTPGKHLLRVIATLIGHIQQAEEVHGVVNGTLTVRSESADKMVFEDVYPIRATSEMAAVVCAADNSRLVRVKAALHQDELEDTGKRTYRQVLAIQEMALAGSPD